MRVCGAAAVLPSRAHARHALHLFCKRSGSGDILLAGVHKRRELLNGYLVIASRVEYNKEDATLQHHDKQQRRCVTKACKHTRKAARWVWYLLQGRRLGCLCKANSELLRNQGGVQGVIQGCEYTARWPRVGRLKCGVLYLEIQLTALIRVKAGEQLVHFHSRQLGIDRLHDLRRAVRQPLGQRLQRCRVCGLRARHPQHLPHRTACATRLRQGHR